MRAVGTVFILFALVATACKPDKPAADESHEARMKATAHALQKADDDRASGQVDQDEEAGSATGLSATERATVVAEIGDRKITLADVERQLAAQPVFARARYRVFEKKVEFLQNLVQFELLALEAQKKGYDTDPDVVLAMKRAMIQKFTQTDLQQLVKVSTVTDEEIERYFENNKPLFNKPAQVRVSHILLPTAEEAATLLKEITSAIGADKPRARAIFSEFARRRSKDTKTAFINGDLNFISADGYSYGEGTKKARFPKPLVDAAFALGHMGAVSGVVKTAKGFHLVQLTNKRPAIRRSLAESKRQITNVLLRQKKDTARQKFIGDLKAKANITIFPEVLKGLKVDNINSSTSVPPTPAHVIPALRKALSPKAPLAPQPLAPSAYQNRPSKVKATTNQEPKPGSKP